MNELLAGLADADVQSKEAVIEARARGAGVHAGDCVAR